MTNNNKKHTGNMGMMILSLIIAIGVWIAVNYLNNPDITTTLSGLHIKFTGEAELRNKGLVITGKSAIPSSSVVVSGKRKDLIDNMNNISVEVNVSEITETGDYSLKGTINLPTTKITVEKEKYGEIPITVEKLGEKEVPVKLRQSGILKNKLVKSELVKDTVKLTGAQSELDNVSYGIADVNAEDIKVNSTIRVKYLLLDNKGEYIEKNETLESYTPEVVVKNTIYDKIILPVNLKLTKEMEKKYVLNENECSMSVSTVEVGVLEGSSDEAVTAYIDNPDTDELTLHEASDMYIPSGHKKIKVKLSLTPKVTKDIELEPSAEGLSAGLYAEIGKITVRVTATEDKINTENINAHVKLDGIGIGEYKLPVEISGDMIEIEGTYTADVKITQ